MVVCLTVWLISPLAMTKRFMVITLRHDMNLMNSIDEEWHKALAEMTWQNPKQPYYCHDKYFMNIVYSPLFLFIIILFFILFHFALFLFVFSFYYHYLFIISFWFSHLFCSLYYHQLSYRPMKDFYYHLYITYYYVYIIYHYFILLRFALFSYFCYYYQLSYLAMKAMQYYIEKIQPFYIFNSD